MPKRDWRERNAFVATGALLGGSVLFAVVLSLWSGHALYDQVTSDYAQHVEDDAQGDIARADTREFQFWEDTFPQYVMAAFSVAATALSGIAVLLVRDTFIQTRLTARAAIAGNRIARRSANRQLRAYVLPTAAKLVGSTELTPNINVQFTNCGSTPAYNPRLMWAAKVHNDENSLPTDDLTPKPLPTIGPNRRITKTLAIQPFHWADLVADIQQPGHNLFVYGTLTYDDAFGVEQHTNIRLKMPNAKLVDSDLFFCDGGNDAT
jgi:hypothetical protein